VITAVADWHELEDAVATADKFVEASDCVLLPGLINMHVHLTFMYATGPVDRHAQRSAASSTAHAVRVASLLLAQGITTAREMGGSYDIPLEMRTEIAEGRVLGPRLLVCNRPISIPGGHASYLCRTASGADEFMTAAREQLVQGVDFVKVMASHDPWPMPGVEQTRPEVTVAEIAAAFATAHDWGKPATCHVMGSIAIDRVLDAGVNVIEHGQYLTATQARRMAADGVFLTPTLSSYDVQTMHARFDRGEPWRLAHELLLEGHRTALAAALEAGVMLLVGTDSVGCYAEEVELLRQAGMPAPDSLFACTAWPARALGLAHEIGTIEAGKRADLVLLGSDPLADPYALEDVRLVLKDGVDFDPEALLYADSLAAGPALAELARRPAAPLTPVEA
jgi:imidazolonepropionase-like amidohydrolase